MRKLVFLPLLGLALACNDSALVEPLNERPEDQTLAAVAVKKILFQDNFEDGDAQGWDLSGAGWSVESEAGNFGLSSSTGNDFAFARLQQPGWLDFRFTSRVKFISGNTYCELLFRIDDEGQHYWLQVTENGVTLNREDGTGAPFEELASRAVTIQQNVWHEFEIAARDNKFKVYVNGSPTINVKDDNPFGTIGTIGFEVHDNTHVHFDDVLVTRLGPEE